MNTLLHLLQVIERHTRLQRAARTHGGEYAGACPFCGGRDRFRVWPYDERPHWWCRGCRRGGDDIAFLRQYEGLNYRDACQRLGVDERLARQQPRPPPSPPRSLPPSRVWQQRAGSFLRLAVECLWSEQGTGARADLHQRGLTDATIKRWQLGYNPSDGSVDAESWDYPAEQERIWIPAGIVIPCWVRSALWSVKIRRPAGVRGGKYVCIAGSVPALFGTETLHGPDGPRRVAVMTEGEFDAMLLQQEAGDLLGVVTMGSATMQPSAEHLWLLRDVRRLLLAYDRDVAGERGLAALAQLSARCVPARPVGAHDLTAMQQAGGDLRAWALYQLRRIGDDH